MPRPDPLPPELVEQMCVLGGVGRPVRTTPRSGGELSGVVEVRTTEAPDPLIVKVYAAQWAWKRAKEVFVYGLLEPVVGWATPTILGSYDQANPTGHAFSIMTRVPGRPLLEAAPELDGTAMAEIYRQIGDLARAIHRIPQGAFGYLVEQIVDPLPTNVQYLERQFGQKLGAFREAGGPAGLAGGIERRVAAAAGPFAECGAAALCHNDLHEGNLLVERTDGRWRLSGLVDVENAIAADPLLDLAKTDCYSIRGDATKLDALAGGYGADPRDAATRLALYRIYHTLDLWVWYHQVGEQQHRSSLTHQLERLTADASDLLGP